MNKQSLLILGITGMLGHVLFTELSRDDSLQVFGTVRSLRGLDKIFPQNLSSRIISDVSADTIDGLLRPFALVRPEVVINCIGLIQQKKEAEDPLRTISMNALLPHRIAQICQAAGARLVHISTDCVFNGARGSYTEKDPSDAENIYGKTKFLGEVTTPPSITIRTSIIGHELGSSYGLVEWFLSQKGTVNGFTKAIYTGFPTVEISRIIRHHVIAKPELTGLYQVSSEPISKYELLKLVRDAYQGGVDIEAYDSFVSDRSLDSSRFRQVTGYTPPSWPQMVQSMHEHFKNSSLYKKS
jgi:dTDP-4-dehydrorhamnose reductase